MENCEKERELLLMQPHQFTICSSFTTNHSHLGPYSQILMTYYYSLTRSHSSRSIESQSKRKKKKKTETVLTKLTYRVTARV